MKNILMNENNIGIIKLYEKKEISIMCGIIGFTGKLKAQDVLLTGLASLEYRGYDSAGIAYFKDTGKISLRKTVGKVKDLRAICDDDNNSTCGISTPAGQPMVALPMPMHTLIRSDRLH